MCRKIHTLRYFYFFGFYTLFLLVSFQDDQSKFCTEPMTARLVASGLMVQKIYQYLSPKALF